MKVCDHSVYSPATYLAFLTSRRSRSYSGSSYSSKRPSCVGESETKKDVFIKMIRGQKHNIQCENVFYSMIFLNKVNAVLVFDWFSLGTAF